MTNQSMKVYQEMNLSDLSKMLVQKTTELKQAKISLKAGNLTNTNKIKNIKREIARINTIINSLDEKNNQEEEK